MADSHFSQWRMHKELQDISAVILADMCARHLTSCASVKPLCTALECILIPSLSWPDWL